jgi:predicted enzyme related to lactoylglutathione lyase
MKRDTDDRLSERQSHLRRRAMSTRVSKIANVIIPVADQDCALQFYSEALGLQTDDIDTYHAQLKDAGIDVDAEISRFGDAVPPMFWLRDPEVNTLMIVEAR